MKKLYLLWMTIATSITLSGCCPSGCFVLHGEAYRKLAHPDPARDSWGNAQTSDQQRSADWIECGGDSEGWFSPSTAALKEEQLPEEKDIYRAHYRLNKRLLSCMETKGYKRIKK